MGMMVMPLRLVLIAIVSGTAHAAAQTSAPPSGAPAVVGAKELSSGWALIAAGRAAEADKASDGLLALTPRSHAALSLKIAARVAMRAPLDALTAYESWLKIGRQHEDVFLLESIALGVIEALTITTDRDVRVRALALMAATGDRSAADRLRTLASDPATASIPGDVALGKLGDASAVQRLIARVKNGGAGDVSDAIDALRDGGVKGAAAVIAAALEPTRPLPTRIAAARALGQLGDTTVVPALEKVLNEPGPVRVQAAAALMRLGDDSGAAIVRTIENSPVGDLRLLAAEARAGVDGTWTTVAKGVLNDPDPLVRLRAAELLLQHGEDTAAARDALLEALRDPNPALRNAAAQRLDRIPPEAFETDLPALRRLLRDPSPLIRLQAAAGLLRIAGAIQ
jgi:HEAT repeat protein